VYVLRNESTGKGIYFNNFALLAGETATLTVANGIMSLRTSFRGVVTTALAPASDNDMALIPGTNSLSFLTSDSSMTATLSFTPQYESLDDMTLAPGR